MKSHTAAPSSGKYWIPTPNSVIDEFFAKEEIAFVTAIHFAPTMDPD